LKDKWVSLHGLNTTTTWESHLYNTT
jgi:hypothetical protein